MSRSGYPCLAIGFHRTLGPVEAQRSHMVTVCGSWVGFCVAVPVVTCLLPGRGYALLTGLQVSIAQRVVRSAAMDPTSPHGVVEACGWDEVREALDGWRSLEAYLPQTERPLPWTPPAPAAPVQHEEVEAVEETRAVQPPKWLTVRDHCVCTRACREPPPQP